MNSLSFKLLSSIVLSIILVLTICLYFTINASKDILNQEIEKTSLSYLNTLEDQIIDFKNNVLQASRIISTDRNIKRALDTQVSRGVNKSINELIKNFPYFHYIIITENNFDIFASSTRDELGKKYLGEELLGLNVKTHPLFINPETEFPITSSVEEDPYLEAIGLNPAKSQWKLSPITIHGENKGWLICSYNWDREIKKLIDKIKMRLESSGAPIIDIQIHPNETELKTNYNSKIYQLSKIIQIGNNKSAIVIKFNKEILNKPINDLQDKLTITMILFVIILLILLYFPIQKLILSRINRLSVAMKEYSKGNLDYKIQDNQLDEFGQLSVTMNQMASTLKLSLNQIKFAKDHLEIQVEERTKMLKQSNQELDEFAYIASHDLKEPIRSIETYATFINEDFRLQMDEEGKENIDSIIRLCKRMSQLLSDLLFFSRAGRAELAIRSTDLNNIIVDVVDSIQPMIKEHNVSIDIPKPLPTIQCDSTRMGEVFRNLIVNAIKYNDKEKKMVEIGYTDNPENKNSNPYIFFIKDNGIGICEDHSTEVFKIFKRLHNRDDYGGGSGSGLTLSQRLLRRHGGDIWLTSELNKGTTFYFKIGDKIENEF